MALATGDGAFELPPEEMARKCAMGADGSR